MKPAYEAQQQSQDSISKVELQRPSIYNEIKSPVDIEAGGDDALAPGGAPSVYSRQNIGLLAHIASVGVVYGTISGVIYSVLNNYLYMSATLTATATALVALPRSLRWIAAMFSDCYPIRGYRRRPYLILGWAITFIACFIMAVLPLGDPYYADPSLMGKDESKMTAKQLAMINHNAPDRGIKLIFLLMFANLGTVIAFGASDGVMVELAQREPESSRGTVQNHVWAVREVFITFSAFMTGLGLNGKDYGGSFSWTMGFNAIMGVCAFFAFITIPICYFCVTETKKEPQSMRSLLVYLYELIPHRVIYQMIGFRFFGQLCVYFTVTASSPIKSTWAKVEPLNDGLSTMLTSILAFVALTVVRRWGLHWSWQAVVVTTQVAVVALDCFPTFFTIWDVYRGQWFWLGVPLLQGISNTVTVYISSLFVVEVCDFGKEATTMSLMVSISDVARPFATVLTKSVDAHFDIERKFIVKDNNHVHWQVTYAYLIAYGFNLFSIVFALLWLPRQKTEARELKRNGGTNKVFGFVTMSYLLFSFAWTIMTNVLSLFASTKCLRIAGGNGC
uniref:Transmembrane protein n=1 Tax=Globisporangium ultimum (strain ATCC 200006 / CBS 805.95 / DAOM BR144) TaxID=431595 RepID=K3WWF4_GLOUD